jgi:hypothetical protein
MHFPFPLHALESFNPKQIGATGTDVGVGVEVVGVGVGVVVGVGVEVVGVGVGVGVSVAVGGLILDMFAALRYIPDKKYMILRLLSRTIAFGAKVAFDNSPPSPMFALLLSTPPIVVIIFVAISITLIKLPLGIIISP